MERRSFFSRAIGALAGFFGIPLVAGSLSFSRADEVSQKLTATPAIIDRIAPGERQFLRFKTLPDGSLHLGGADIHNVLRRLPDGSLKLDVETYGHTMFGDQGAIVTASELNWWALHHDGVIDYDEFLLWKIEHPGQNYIGSEDSINEIMHGTRQYMQGMGTRSFQGARVLAA